MAQNSNCLSKFYFQGLIIYILILIPSTRNQYQHLYQFAGDQIYAYSRISPKNHTICNEMAIDLFTGSVKITLLLVYSLFLMIAVPLYKNLFTDEHEFIMLIILPFINPDKQNGFYINLVNQMISCSYATIIVPAIELVTCVLKNAVTVIAAVIENALLEFAVMLENSEGFTVECNWHLRNIIMKILDFDKFDQFQSKRHSSLNFIHVFFSSQDLSPKSPNSTTGNFLYSQSL